jgi:hypothetical protein
MVLGLGLKEERLIYYSIFRNLGVDGGLIYRRPILTTRIAVALDRQFVMLAGI